jgi:hypothetical protein
MNKLLLLRPISRAIRVPRPVTCYSHLNKSLSTTTCRKFGSTSTTRAQRNPPPLPEAPAPLILTELEEAETVPDSETDLAETAPDTERTDLAEMVPESEPGLAEPNNISELLGVLLARTYGSGFSYDFS